MRSFTTDRKPREDGVSSLIAYIVISGILMVLIVITMILVSNTVIQRPADQLTYYAFTDIANGVSTKIVDVYAIPSDKSAVSITSKLNIPETVAGRSYFVDIQGTGESQNVIVSGNSISSTVYLSGIGATRSAGGNTTGSGIKQISYNYP